MRQQFRQVLAKIQEAIYSALRGVNTLHHTTYGWTPSRDIDAGYFTHLIENDKDLPWGVDSPWLDEKGVVEESREDAWLRLIRDEALKLELDG